MMCAYVYMYKSGQNICILFVLMKMNVFSSTPWIFFLMEYH